MPDRRRGFLTTTSVFWVLFLIGVAALEWVVLKEQSFGVGNVWDEFVSRMGYLIPVSVTTALVHGGLVELLSKYRHSRGKSYVRRLSMPITAAIAAVVLMAFPSIPEYFVDLGHSVFGQNRIADHLIQPVGIALLATAVAVLFGASGGGLRGRR